METAAARTEPAEACEIPAARIAVVMMRATVAAASGVVVRAAHESFGACDNSRNRFGPGPPATAGAGPGTTGKMR